MKAKLIEAIREDSAKAYQYGFAGSLKEESVELRKDTLSAEVGDKVSINWNLTDQGAMDEITQGGLILSDDFYKDTNAKIQRVIAESFADQRSIPSVVASLREVVQTETWKLTRIARTEINNAANEGKLAGFKRIEEKRKLLYQQGKIKKKPKEQKYTLIVALGARTCGAHKLLASRIPSGGLILSELKELQMQIAPQFGMTLSGNAQLHPNQRTVISRVV